MGFFISLFVALYSCTFSCQKCAPKISPNLPYAFPLGYILVIVIQETDLYLANPIWIIASECEHYFRRRVHIGTNDGKCCQSLSKAYWKELLFLLQSLLLVPKFNSHPHLEWRLSLFLKLD